MSETVTNTIETKVVLDTSRTQQEMAKLNGVATDTTKALEERIKAKNKAVELSNSLHKQNIATLEKEVNTLKDNGAKASDVEKAQKKLNAARVKAAKDTASQEKNQNKMNATLAKSKSATANLDAATGGLTSKMGMLAANPIFIVVGILAGLFKILKESIGRTEDSAADMSAIFAGLGQIMTNLFEWVADFVEPILSKLAELFQKDLGPVLEAFGGFVDAGALALKGYINAVELLLTPLKALWATAQAAALALKGDFAGAKQVFVDLKDEVVATAVSMVDNFVGAVEVAVDTVNEIGEAFQNAAVDADGLIAKAARIEQIQNQLNKDKRAQLLEDAKLGVASKKALADAKDLNLTWEERLGALKEFSDIERKRELESGKILEREIELQKARMSLGRNTQEDEEELNNLLIEREKHKERLATQDLMFNRKSKEFYDLQRKEEHNSIKAVAKRFATEMELRIRNGEDQLTLQKELLQKQKEAALWDIELTEQQRLEITADFKEQEFQLSEQYRLRELESSNEMDALDLERRTIRGENTTALELQFLEKKKNQELDNAKLTASERLVIEEKYGVASLKVKKKNRDQQIAFSHDVVDAAQDVLGALWGDNKNMARAMAYINMLQGVSRGVALGFPAAIPAIASALAVGGSTLRDINTAKPPAGISDSGGGSAPIAPPSITAISSISEITPDPAANGLSETAQAAAAASDTTNKIIFSEAEYQEFQDQVTFKDGRSSF